MIQAKAFLFDMDGTLVDSTYVVENEWIRFSKKHSLDPREVISYAHGRQTIDTVSNFLGKESELTLIANEIDERELTIMDGIIATPGALDLLKIIPSNRWAIVTSASRQLAINRMEAAGLPLPDVMICAEDVKEGKPSPEGYIKAALYLGYPITECVVFEDAHAGILAGINSGAKVISVNPDAMGSESASIKASLNMISVEINQESFCISRK